MRKAKMGGGMMKRDEREKKWKDPSTIKKIRHG